MNPGEALHVLVKDPDVAKGITTLVRQRPGYRIDTDHMGDHYRLTIRKGDKA